MPFGLWTLVAPRNHAGEPGFPQGKGLWAVIFLHPPNTPTCVTTPPSPNQNCTEPRGVMSMLYRALLSFLSVVIVS